MHEILWGEYISQIHMLLQGLPWRRGNGLLEMGKERDLNVPVNSLVTFEFWTICMYLLLKNYFQNN